MSFQPLCQFRCLSYPREQVERVAERVISTIFHQRRRGNENTTIIEIIRHRTVKQDTRLLTPIIYIEQARDAFFSPRNAGVIITRDFSYNLQGIIEVGFFKKNYLIL